MISISRTRMLEEIKTDNNCIIKAFENNPISIIEENVDIIPVAKPAIIFVPAPVLDC